ncbi:hypothetical protein DYB35_012898 [Aphanomyces astaci]|uniref:Tc1-like transposase DDE domain-containing protein n=1 Tax=Aphanomyces astaci TaxID=112090 RepID=A0A3R6ZT90_APHAT|nr:hypothetical protein DYB35_012898 [Aphanomyces astaci]
MENQPQRTSRELTGRDKARLIQLLRPFLKNDKLQRGAYKHVAEILQIHPRTVSYIWRKFRDTGSTTSNKVGKVGPKPTYSKQLVQMNASTRLELELDNIWDGVHLDEKCFNADKDRRKVYLVSGEKPPRRAWKSKRFVPKVMFLAAVARPRYDEVRGVFFNGKVGMWPFVRLVPAIRNSRNRPAGTMVTILVNVDGVVYRDYVLNKVIPAIKASFPSANKRVVLQHDNATPHGAITDSELAAVSTDGWTFVMRRQPPNSPDLNVLDLGFFASIQSLQYKKMSRSVDDVVRHTMEEFDELNHEKLDNVFLTFLAVMRLILEHSGRNGYALPHLKKESLRRAGLLMSNVSCPVSLLL